MLAKEDMERKAAVVAYLKTLHIIFLRGSEENHEELQSVWFNYIPTSNWSGYLFKKREKQTNLKNEADTRVYPKVSGLAVWSENCK
jgi:hypothetical protein